MLNFFPFLFVFFWSSAFVSGQIIVQSASPFASLSFRFMIVALEFIVFAKIFNEKITFSIVGKTGYVVGLGQDVEISDRFILGDSTFVGFQNGGIGTRDKSDDSALGGNLYYTFTPEMKFGLGLPVL